jgi:hypothetical protein
MRRRTLILVAVIALVVGIGAGAAYAYWTTGGSGTGHASNGTMTTVTVATAGTPSSPLLPGGPAGDVTFSVTNNNSFPVSLVGVAFKTGGTIAFDGSHTGCSTTDSSPVVTLNVPGGDLPISIAAGQTLPVDLASAVTMDVAATNNCQGATIYVPVTITVHSS